MTKDRLSPSHGGESKTEFRAGRIRRRQSFEGDQTMTTNYIIEDTLVRKYLASPFNDADYRFKLSLEQTLRNFLARKCGVEYHSLERSVISAIQLKKEPVGTFEIPNAHRVPTTMTTCCLTGVVRDRATNTRVCQCCGLPIKE